MANNRMQLYCKKCLQAIALAKYYPYEWYSVNIEERLNDFFQKHQDECFKTMEDIGDCTSGADMFGLRTEADYEKDGYATAHDPYRVTKTPRWRPKNGDTFWCIDTVGHVVCSVLDEEKIDFNFFEFGNYFFSREEAQAARPRVKKALRGE